ncbi:hypothetical protein P9209_00340 [Prescottella defluvii]|nr:hypothetical protein P9209_00340 [Prescottella defluvii]
MATRLRAAAAGAAALPRVVLSVIADTYRVSVGGGGIIEIRCSPGESSGLIGLVEKILHM